MPRRSRTPPMKGKILQPLRRRPTAEKGGNIEGMGVDLSQVSCLTGYYGACQASLIPNVAQGIHAQNHELTVGTGGYMPNGARVCGTLEGCGGQVITGCVIHLAGNLRYDLADIGFRLGDRHRIFRPGLGKRFVCRLGGDRRSVFRLTGNIIVPVD